MLIQIMFHIPKSKQKINCREEKNKERCGNVRTTSSNKEREQKLEREIEKEMRDNYVLNFKKHYNIY